MSDHRCRWRDEVIPKFGDYINGWSTLARRIEQQRDAWKAAALAMVDALQTRDRDNSDTVSTQAYAAIAEARRLEENDE